MEWFGPAHHETTSNGGSWQQEVLCRTLDGKYFIEYYFLRPATRCHLFTLPLKEEEAKGWLEHHDMTMK